MKTALKTVISLTIFGIISIVLFTAHIYAGVTRETRPEIYCEFMSSMAPIDKSRVSMTVDGQDVTAQAQILSWRVSYTPTEPLPPGRHDVRVVVFDLNGGRGEKSWSFTIDPQAQDTARPTLEFVAPTPENGAVIMPNTPIRISMQVNDDHSGPDPATLKLSMSRDGAGVEPFTGSLDFENGLLSLPPATLEPGVYVLQATIADHSGNTSDTAMTAFTVRAAQEQEVGLLEQIEQPARRRTGDFYIDALPAFTSQDTLEIRGRAPDNAALSLIVNGAPAADFFAEPTGDFSFPNTSLIQGENEIIVALLSKTGLIQRETEPEFVTLDTTPPDITDFLNEPDDGVGFSFSDDGSGIASVQLTIDGMDVTYAMDIFGGSASYEPASPFEQGRHIALATVTDIAGNTAQESWGFVITPEITGDPVDDSPFPDDLEPDDPEPDITEPVDEPEPGDTETDVKPQPVQDPLAEPEEDEEPEPEPDIEVEVTIRTSGNPENKKINVHGQAPHGAEITLYVNDAAMGVDTANPGGQYHFQNVPLSTGDNIIRAVAQYQGSEYSSPEETVYVEGSKKSGP